MSARRLTTVALVSLCALAGWLALPAAPAQAAVVHKYLSSMAEAPPEPTGLAVDSGDLYVVGSTRLNGGGEGGSSQSVFDDATGALIAQFPEVPSLSFLHEGVGVGHATGEAEVYVGGAESREHGVVAVFSPTGALQNTWKGTDTPAGSFGCFEGGNLCGNRFTGASEPNPALAVDDSSNPLTKGDVYVAAPEQGVVDVFEPKAGGGERYITQIPGPEPEANPEDHFGWGGAQEAFVAVDQVNGDVLVASFGEVVEFEPGPLNTYKPVLQFHETPGGPISKRNPPAYFEGLGVTVDGGDGDIYVWARQTPVVYQFGPEGAYLGELNTKPVEPPSGLLVAAVAVDPTTHRVYVGGNGGLLVYGEGEVVPDVATDGVANVKVHSATLEGTVDPDEAGVATCRFEVSAAGEATKSVPCELEEGALLEGDSPVAVHADLSGLSIDTTYTYHLVASNANGTNPGTGVIPAEAPQQFTTLGPALVGAASVAEVASSSATLRAQIDPNGTPTSYYFQYGTSASYGTSVPAAPGFEVGAGAAAVPVSVHLQRLQPGTVYHYRVVAVSEPAGEPITLMSADETFATQAAGTAIALPDGREWEMVSPPNKQGAAIIAVGNEQGSDIQAAADGAGITYTSNGAFVVNPPGSRPVEPDQILSTRQAPGIWQTQDITTPNETEPSPVLAGHAAEYKLFSSDLSVGLVEPPDSSPLPPLPPGSEKTIYLRMASGEYRALVTSANVAPGVKFGELDEIEFVEASPDLSHVVIRAKVALLEGAPSEGLYEWSEGRLRLVSVPPTGEVALKPTVAGLGDNGAGYTNGGGSVARDAISGNGSRVVWEGQPATSNTETRYYLRDTTPGEEESVWINAPQEVPAPPEQANKAVYQTASGDDSRVFFTSGARLTSNSTAPDNAESPDLYVYEVTSRPGERLAGRLTDLTVAANPGESAAVRNAIGASEDGSYVYFMANGVLGEGARHGARAGGNNLYVVHYDEAAKAWMAPVFIAALSGADQHSWGGPGFKNLQDMTSRVSPNGQFLAFMSEESLTGYDNRDAVSGEPDEEVFVYDADTGRVVCASCDPTGARPVGSNGSASYEERLWDYAQLWGGRWVAGDIPGWTTRDVSTAIYQSRYLSNEGRLFFNSSDALVPADVDGSEDVYEYEPAGVGSCRGPGYGQSASVVYSEAAGGCVGLISGGTSPEESAFMDASESGGDVFFITTSRLSPQDYDDSYDMYDAHECTVAAPCATPEALAPAPCATGDACKPAPTPQPAIFGSPASETFSGAGNLAPPAAAVKPGPKAKPVKCRGGSRRNKRGKCVKDGKAKAKKSAKGRK
ncbi:MAG TPA: hypothetical protein VNV42_13560 [Solirubrobacteraceae bacterium]|jgi:hypothetical protein|nr:hypothetical protein [Solirubrobacteraceae bacterium]